jgi:WD40 repeat protein
MNFAAAREKLARKFLGHDVFVSYSRADGASYAAHLANELTKHNLSCRLDQWGSKPGKEVPAEILRDLRRSNMLVVVGSTGAATSAAVEREIVEFLPTDRLIIPIDIDGSIRSARWWPSLEGLAIAREAGPQSKPSEETIDRIVNSVDFTRRNTRLTRYSISSLVVFAVLAVLALLAGQRAAKEIRRAAEETQRAEAASKQTTAADASRKRAEGQQGVAEKKAQRAAKDAQKQQKLAEAARREREVAETQLAATARDLDEQTVLAESRRYKQTLPIVDRYLGEGRLNLACQTLDQMPLEPRNWEWGYYRAHCERDLFTLTNRDERVEIPGRPAYLGFSEDGTLALWNSETGQLVRRLGVLCSCSASLPGVSHFTNVVASPDGTRRARGTGSGSILLFEGDAEKPFLTIQAHQEPVTEVHFSPDGKLLVSRCGFAQLPPDKSVPDDHTARVWEIPTGKAVATLEEGSRPVDFTLFSPDSRRVLTASMDDVARLWDARTGGLVARLAGHTSGIGEAAFSQDGSLVLTTSGWKCSAKIWANQADQRISAVPVDDNEENHFDIRHVEFPGKSVEIKKSLLQLLDYDLPKPYIFKEFKGHTQDILHSRFLEHGKTLLTVSLDHTARVWDVASGTFRIIPVGGYKNTGYQDGHSRELFAAVLLDHGKRLLTAAEDGFLKVWDVRSGRCLLTIDWIGRERRSPEKRRFQTAIFRLSRDRRFIAIRPYWDAREPIKVWNLTTGKLVSSLLAAGRELKTAHFSPDSSRLVTVTSSIMEKGYETALFWTALVWDVEQGEVVATLRLDGAKYAGSGGGGVSHLVDGSVKLDKAMAAAIKGSLSSGELYDADFDAEGQSIFAISSDYRIWTWTGLPSRLRKMNPVDFTKEIRAWKLKRLLEYLDREGSLSGQSWNFETRHGIWERLTESTGAPQNLPTALRTLPRLAEDRAGFQKIPARGRSFGSLTESYNVPQNLPAAPRILYCALEDSGGA